MAQYKIWYALQLKAWLKRKTSWLQVLGMILLVLLTARIVKNIIMYPIDCFMLVMVLRLCVRLKQQRG